jgi:hypothetical protein
MADPLSITASIIAVIQATSKVVSLCYDYRSGLKNAPSEMKQLTDEITSLRDILESILKLVDEGGTEYTYLPTLKILTQSDGVLPKCKAEMTLLETDLKPVTGIRAVARTLKWPYARGEVEKKVERLGRLKSSLTLALAIDHT